MGARRTARTARLAALVAVALLTSGLAIVAPAAPVAGEGNEAPGAPAEARGLTSGQTQGCAILSNGAVKCWGANASGQLGLGDMAARGDNANEMGDTLLSPNLGTGRTATALTAGDSHTCAILDNGAMKCWGLNQYGTLGLGDQASRGDGANEMGDVLPAVSLGTGRTAIGIAAGVEHTCALLDNGTVKCWGRGDFGALGRPIAGTGGGANQMGDNLPTVDLGTGRTATAITTGHGTTCALLDNGAVKCWGRGSNGQLGLGDATSRGDAANEMGDNLPTVDLGTGRTATAISTGEDHTCALLDNSTVKCWGNNNIGQLGLGDTVVRGDGANEMGDNLPAIDLGTGRTATAISAGGQHTCALLDNSTVKCWGNNARGQLGRGDSNARGNGSNQMGDNLAAIDLGTGRTATAITAGTGGNGSTCVRLDNAQVKCWGDNSSGRLGLGDTSSRGDGANEMGDNLPPVNLFTPAPALTVAKTSDESHVVEGDTVHLHVTVTNTGNVALYSVTITDPNATGCQAAAFTLAVGASATVDCTHVAAATDVAGGYHNTASVASNSYSSTGTLTAVTPVTSNTVDVTVDAAAPALSLDVSAQETSVAPGATIHYHVTVTNTGNVALHDVDVTDTAAPDCGDDALFDLAVSAVSAFDCTYVTTGNDVGTLHNSASAVSASGVVPGVTTPVVSNQVDVTVTPAVTVVKSRDETSVVAGEAVHYHLHVTNTSALTLTGLTVTDAHAPACDGTLPTLAPGADTTVDCTYTSTVGDVGTYANTAVVDSPDITAVTSNQVDVGVDAQAPSYTVVASVDEANAVEGDTLHLHVKVTNTGNMVLHHVTVTDALAPGCEVAPFTVAKAADHTVDCTHVATAGDVPAYAHSASVDTDETSPVSSNQVDVPVAAAAPAMTVVTSADEASVAPGQAIHYHVVVSNTGNVALHDVDVTDTAAPDCGDDSTFDVAVNAFVTVNCSYTTTGNDVGTYANTASAVSAAGVVPGVTTPVVSNQVNVTVNPAVTVTKSADETAVTIGQPIHYHVHVTNTSALTLTGLTLADTHAPGCAGTLPTLAPSADTTIDCTYTAAIDDVGTYHNTATVDSPAITAVTSNQVDVSITVPAGQGIVRGTLTETGTGAPINGGQVAVLTTSSFALRAGATAGLTGSYQTLLPTGTYFLYVLDPTGAHRDGFFGAPATVTITNGATTTANPTLAPTRGGFSGTMTDATSGAPISNGVFIGLAANGRPERGAATNGAGHFALTGVPAGNYKGVFVDLTGLHTPEFYNDQPGPGTANTFGVTAGANTSGIDAGLTPRAGPGTGAHLVGDITDTQGAPLEGVAVLALSAATFQIAAGDLTDASGHYDIPVALGGYKLVFYDPSGGHQMEWYDDVPFTNMTAAVTVTPTATAPVKRRNAALTPSVGAMTGTIREAGSGTPISGAWVLALGSSGIAGGGFTNASGAYALSGLPVGTYRAAFIDPTGTHALEYWDDSPDYAHSNAFVLSGVGAASGIDADLTANGP